MPLCSPTSSPCSARVPSNVISSSLASSSAKPKLPASAARRASSALLAMYATSSSVVGRTRVGSSRMVLSDKLSKNSCARSGVAQPKFRQGRER